ncbi:MCE family protein [Nocardia jinanensis]|uniref:Mammalian cell entry protein n=1 Tax=Nocardia jinanensis TaxID=382504 RepID=A0A917VT71_9NOCA|nr:MCE family protein [Nocardia jinanensis]GGL15331.1 mammalian cell entry protein [Nocardia jinanensis]
MRISATIVKFSVFALVMLMVLFGLVAVFGKLRFQDRAEYSADFVNVSGLRSGQFVRIAGIEVGRVESVGVLENTLARVSFSLDKDVVVSGGTRAVVRYENLVGDRYLELLEGPGASAPLPAGAAIGLDHTSPALDLDALIGGFRPLFKALDPDQVNQLSAELISVLQGEGGTVANVLSRTAQLTGALADRDQLIGAVITNLNGLLATIDDRDEQFDSMVDNLQQLVRGITAQADPVADSLAHLGATSATVASLLDVTRPDISADVQQLGRVSTNIDNDRDYMDGLLSRLPHDYQRLSRLGLYGDFFNFYLCDLTLKVNGPNGDPTYIDVIGQRAGRCTAP